MKAKIMNAQGHIVKIVNGGIEFIKVNTPQGHTYEIVPDNEHIKLFGEDFDAEYSKHKKEKNTVKVKAKNGEDFLCSDEEMYRMTRMLLIMDETETVDWWNGSKIVTLTYQELKDILREATLKQNDIINTFNTKDK